jgi:hypothetical protein
MEERPEGGMAAGADGLPLPPPDDAERRLAEDSGEAENADEELEGEEESRAREISAERGAD